MSGDRHSNKISECASVGLRIRIFNEVKAQTLDRGFEGFTFSNDLVCVTLASVNENRE